MMRWYLQRILVMPPAEIGHRVVERYRRFRSRYHRQDWTTFDLGDGSLAAIEPFKSMGVPPWPLKLVRTIDDLVAQNQLSFMGQKWPAGAQFGQSPGLWFRDPVSGKHWPGSECFTFDGDYRRLSASCDIKVVLELNRLQTLHAWAAQSARERNPERAQAAARVLINWMDENPPFTGVNWLSGIELSMRMVSAAFVVAALVELGAEQPFRRQLRSFVAAHAYWLHRFPSLYSSANNHRVAEGLGLYIASCLVPDMPQARLYREEGRAVLTDIGARQFHPDGINAEQSPTYAAFTLEMLLLGVLVARGERAPLPAALLGVIERGALALRAMLDEAGNHPHIGDDDETRVVACTAVRETKYVASVVAAAAGVLDCPRLAPPAHDVELRDIIFCSPSASVPTNTGLLTFAAGGYSVARDDVAGRRVMLVMDHGPLGQASLAAHGHADALAVWLHIDDQPVFVDAGTFRYHACEAWRTWFRSTAAHNALVLGTASQSVVAGPFLWRHQGRARLISQKTSTEGWEVIGEADGYLRRFGRLHRRVCRRTGARYEIIDCLHPGSAAPPATVSFLIHPSLRVQQYGKTIIISRGDDELVQLTVTDNAWPEVISPNPLDRLTAFSEHYSDLSPAQRIVIRLKPGWQSSIAHLTILEPARPITVPKVSAGHAVPVAATEALTV